MSVRTSGTRPAGIARVSLISGRTGVPLFLLYLERDRPGHRALQSLEQVESLREQAETPWDVSAWKNVETFFLAGGTEAHALVLPRPKDTNDFTALLGRDGGVGRRTGIQTARDWSEKIDLLLIPQATDLVSTENYAGFCQAVFEVVGSELGMLWLLDLPRSFGVDDAEKFLRKSFCVDAATFHPWLLTEHGAMPPSVAIAGWLQRADQEQGLAEMSAKELRAGWLPLRVVSASDRTRYLEARANTFLVHEGRTRPWGGYTLADKTQGQFRLIPLRRTSTQIRRAVEELCEPFVLEAVDAELPVWVESRLKNFLREVRSLFHPDRAEPFSTTIEVIEQEGEEKLQVGLSYVLPHSTEKFAFSFTA